MTQKKTENWKEGVRNGESKTFFYQGHIQKTENYKDGKKYGWFEEYHPDQTPKHRVLYEADVLIEEYKYDEHGREIYSFPKFNNGGGDEDDAKIYSILATGFFTRNRVGRSENGNNR